MRILAGDIGGTKTRLALYQSKGDKLLPARGEIFPSNSFSSLEEIIDKFLPLDSKDLGCAGFGVAGPIVDGRCFTTNLSWVVELEELQKRLGIREVFLINDLEAAAFGIPFLPEEDFFVLNPGKKQTRGNIGVIAAGTGLGEAFLGWTGGTCRAFPSEGGHTEFGPRNETEMDLLKFLRKEFSHVSYERVVSGPGLKNIYLFFRKQGHTPEPDWLTERMKKKDPSKVITETALEGKDEACKKALDLFISVFGAEAGNLALKTLATGGIYIAGGIAPKIRERIAGGNFMKAFTDKGRYESLMKNIPVSVVLNKQIALTGAAQYALQQVSPTR